MRNNSLASKLFVSISIALLTGIYLTGNIGNVLSQNITNNTTSDPTLNTNITQSSLNSTSQDTTGNWTESNSSHAAK